MCGSRKLRLCATRLPVLVAGARSVFARVRHFLRFAPRHILSPPTLRWHGPSSLCVCSWCVRVCARSCAYLCAGKRRNMLDDEAIPSGRSVFLYEHAVVVAMLIIFFKSLFFLIFTIVLPLSLISVVRFKCLFTIYGSFCSIPLPLLLRRGLFTINLLVFLFTE